MRHISLLLVVVFSVALLAVTESNVYASSLPPWPNVYSGYIYVDGVPAEDGSLVVGKVDTYISQAVAVKDGRYAGLAVGPPHSGFFGKAVTFHLNDAVTANETDIFQLNEWINVDSSFDLNFPSFPTPTPVPSATPTATPLPAPTPEVPAPMILSGVVELDAGNISDLEGAEVVVRLGSFFSAPAVLSVESVGSFEILVFDDLLLNPAENKFMGQTLSFIVDGIEATGTFPTYAPGGTSDVAMRVSIPEIVVDEGPSSEGVPPTVLPPPATATPLVVPTQAPATVVPATPVPAAPVTAPPAPVVVVVTATPEPEAEEPIGVEESGGCNLAAPVAPLTGGANALMLFAPLLLIGAYKGMKISKRRSVPKI